MAKLKSGNNAPKRGQYTEIGPRGGRYRTVTMKKGGDTMPPTEKASRYFKKK